MKNEHPIIYMGTPEFAVEPLKQLIETGFNVCAVVTTADKPAGRGLKVHSSPVKEFAVKNNILVLQPIKLSDPDFIKELKSLNADLFIVVAFRKLPEVVWKLPRLGCFNLHASLLPQYRGAAPINHAVINGETVTGVTTFFLNDEIDTGKIIKQVSIPIGPNESAGELHDRMMVIGAELVVDTTKVIINNTFNTIDQTELTVGNKVNSNISAEPVNETDIKKAPKIFRDDCRIHWKHSASSVHNFIRGLSPYPGAYSILETNEGEKELKLLKSQITDIPGGYKPGTIIIDHSKLFVNCCDQLLEILIVQPAGKKAMTVDDYLRGNRSQLISFIS